MLQGLGCGRRKALPTVFRRVTAPPPSPPTASRPPPQVATVGRHLVAPRPLLLIFLKRDQSTALWLLFTMSAVLRRRRAVRSVAGLLYLRH